NDFLRGDGGNDTLIGCTFNWGGEGAFANDTLVGSEGDDSLYGGDGADWLDGGEDNGILTGGGGNDNLHAEAGVAAGLEGGGEADDGLFAGVGWAEELTGGPGSDRFLRSGEDTTTDNVADVDALFRFVGDGTAVWQDGEIELLDEGLLWLHQLRGNAWLIS